MFGKKLAVKDFGNVKHILKEQSCFWVILTCSIVDGVGQFRDQVFTDVNEAWDIFESL